MNRQRVHIEMRAVDTGTGWQALAGFAHGLETKLLSDDLDEIEKTGGRTRLVRFAAGATTTQTLVHDYWEEVYMLSGDLRPVGLATPTPGAPAYSCRPPGTAHGPFVSDAGCMLLEMQYYAPSRRA